MQMNCKLLPLVPMTIIFGLSLTGTGWAQPTGQESPWSGYVGTTSEKPYKRALRYNDAKRQERLGELRPIPSRHNGLPNTTIARGPVNITNETTTSYKAVASPRTPLFECKLDAAKFRPCPFGWSRYRRLGDGPHTFQVRAVSATGQRDPTPAVDKFTVDTTPPNAEIVDKPASITGGIVSFSFQSSEYAPHYLCSLDGVDYSPCSDFVSYSTGGDGDHKLSVKATDTAGNIDPEPATYQWHATGTMPEALTAVLTKSPPNPSTPVARFDLASGRPDARFKCSLDGSPYSECPQSVTFTDLPADQHTFAFKAYLPDGQAAPPVSPPTTYTWTLRRNGLIAFHDWGPLSGLYLMNADGTGKTRFAGSSYGSGHFSPDGHSLALYDKLEQDSYPQIYEMNVDGSNRERLTDGATGYVSPDYSPDATRFALLVWDDVDCTELGCNNELYTLDRSTNQLKRLTNDTYRDEAPAFSPDSTTITYTSALGNPKSEIALIDSDGSGGPTNLTKNNDCYDQWSDFSPDTGKVIYMSSCTSSVPFHDGIATIQTDGTGKSYLVDVLGGGTSFGDPSYSPDGKRVAFWATNGPDGDDYTLDGGYGGIYVMNADCSDLQRLTDPTSFADSPAWSPIYP